MLFLPPVIARAFPRSNVLTLRAKHRSWIRGWSGSPLSSSTGVGGEDRPPLSSLLRPHLSPHASVLVSSKLRRSDLLSLFSHDEGTLALVVREYVGSQEARELGDSLADAAYSGDARNWASTAGGGRGAESTDVCTLGEHVPFNIASAGGTDAESAYFDGVVREVASRGSEGGAPHPLDALREDLDEAWPGGCGLRTGTDGREFGGGLPRIMFGPTRWRGKATPGFVHADEFGWLDEKLGTFSANIYLSLPGDEPGDKPSPLQIFPLSIHREEDWEAVAPALLEPLSAQDVVSQVAIRKALGDPVEVDARPGDLVIFCVQRPHCAVGFDDGVRVSLQCFVTHQGPEEKLLIDC